MSGVAVAASIIICGALINLTARGLSTFARYTGRRAAQAEEPHELFGPASSRWFAVFLAVTVLGLVVCLALCFAVLHFVGGAS
jgi:hypothetical protein